MELVTNKDQKTYLRTLTTFSKGGVHLLLIYMYIFGSPKYFQNSSTMILLEIKI